MVKKIFLIFISIFLLFGCKDVKKEKQKIINDMDNQGLNSECMHELIKLDKNQYMNGEFNANFLSGTSGNVSTNIYYFFMWENSKTGFVYHSVLLSSQIKFKIIENNSQKPSLQIFCKKYLLSNGVYPTCDRKIIFSNNNILFKSNEYLKYVIINISRKDLIGGHYIQRLNKREVNLKK